MAISSGIPGYSFQYSADVIDQFIEHYWRATNIVAEVFHWKLSTLRKAMIYSFMRNQVRWKLARNTIKQLENDEGSLSLLKKLSLPEAQKYLTAIKSLEEDFFLDTGNFRS